MLIAAGLLAPAVACVAMALAVHSALNVRMAGLSATARVRTAIANVRNTGGALTASRLPPWFGAHPSFWWHVRSASRAFSGCGGGLRHRSGREGDPHLIATAAVFADLVTHWTRRATLPTVTFLVHPTRDYADMIRMWR